ncbi:uncharacterized protein LOC126987868 [Eriocheir sinensis]|uniref:uncharacterized protein LOC126987868 n=1 Tax=Eriocheir sinensis TaxID=95602 RepID=UPI0021C9A3FC|nr:uncharacterized protein LOC126987868 [Eriocheir sinensis]
MGPRTYMRIVFNTHKSQASECGRSGRNIQVQVISCHKVCRKTTSVKNAVKRLARVKQKCEIYKRRSFLPLDTQKSWVSDGTRPDEELAVNTYNDLKFSTTVEILTVSTGSEAVKRNRAKIINSLVDSPVNTTQASSTNNHVGSSASSKQTEGTKTACSDTSPLVITPNLYPSIISKEKQNPKEQKMPSLRSGVKRGGDVTQTEMMIETRRQNPRKLKSIGKIVPGKSVGNNVSGKNVSKNVSGKSVGNNVSGKNVSKNVSGKSVGNNVSGKNISKNVSEKCVGKNVSGKSAVMDMSGKKCTGNLKTPACSKKRGTKRKACGEDSLLQQMFKCFTILKDSPKDSHRHISQLLGQEIEKQKEGDMSSPPLKKHSGQPCNSTSRNDDLTELKVDDHRSEILMEESNTESHVLGTNFFVEQAAAGENQDISISLFPTTVLSPNINIRMDNITEKECVGRFLENDESLLPVPLTPHHTQQDSQSFASIMHASAKQLELPCSQSKLEISSPQNLQPVVDRTQAELLSCSPHHLQSNSHSSPHPKQMKLDSSFSTDEDTNLHSSVPHKINMEPHISEPQHALSESHISDPHLKDGEPCTSLLYHTRSEPYSQDARQMETGLHSYVPHHTSPEPYSSSQHLAQKEPHSYSLHHIPKDFHSLTSHHTNMMSYSSVPHHTHTEDHSSVHHTNETEPQSSVSQATQQESHSSHMHTQSYCLPMPKEPHDLQMQTEPHNPLSSKESHASLMQIESHASCCKTTSHSLHLQTEPISAILACASGKKGKHGTEEPNMPAHSYNLRSKETRSLRRKSLSTSKAKSTYSVLSTHCKSDLVVCLRRVDQEFPNLEMNVTKARSLRQQPRSTADASMSLPVYIDRSLIQLPSKNVMKFQDRFDDSEKIEDVDDEHKEDKVNGSNRKACINGSQEWVAQKEDRKMSAEDTQREPGVMNYQAVGGAQCNHKGTGTKSSPVVVSAENILKDDNKCSETSIQNYQAIIGNNLMETDVKNHQLVADVDNNARETSVGDYQTVVGVTESVEGKSAEDFQRMDNIDDNTEKRCIKGYQIIDGDKSIEQTDSEDCQIEDAQKIVGAVNTVEETDTGDCQKMVDTDNSIEETDSEDAQKMADADSSIEEGKGKDCQKMVGAEDRIEEAVTKDCQKMVGAGDSIEEAVTKDCQKMVGAEDRIEEAVTKDCQKMVGAEDRIEEAVTKDCQKMVGAEDRIEEAVTKDCQKMVGAEDRIEEPVTKDCQKMVGAEDRIEEAVTKDCQKMVGAEDSIEEAVTKDCQKMVGAEDRIEEAVTKDCQKMVGAGDSIEETDVDNCKETVGAGDSIEETDVDNCKETVGAGDSIEETDVDNCKETVGAGDSIEETDVDNCNEMVGAGDSIEETDVDNCNEMVGAGDSIEETDVDNCQEMVGAGDSTEETDAEDCHQMIGSDDNIEDTDAKDCQEMDRANKCNNEINVETCQMAVGADDVKEIGTESFQTVTSSHDKETCLEKNLRETNVENYQLVVGTKTSIQERETEHCQMVMGVDNNVTGTYSNVSRGGTGGEACQLVVGAENTLNGTDVEGCHMAAGTDKSVSSKYVNSSHERISEESSQMMIGVENTQGRAGFESCDMMLDGDGNLEETFSENCQTYDDNTFSYLVSSLNGVSNNNYFDIHNIDMSLEETDMFLNFESKEKSVLCEPPNITTGSPELVSNIPPAGENLQESFVEQSVSIAIDDKNTTEHGSVLSGHCKAAALDHSSCPDSNIGEENMAAQYVYQMPNEAQIFEALKSSFKNSEDCQLQENIHDFGAAPKENLVNKKLKAERCAGVEGGSWKEDPGPPAASDSWKEDPGPPAASDSRKEDPGPPAASDSRKEDPGPPERRPWTTCCL